MVKKTKVRWSEILVAFCAAALPFKAGGCGHTACITLRPSEVQSGMCPSLEAATARIVGGACPPGPVNSVDGPGTMDGNLCCYPITPSDRGNDSFIDCGFGGETTGFGVTTGVGGFGGTNTTGPCLGCAAIFDGALFNQICPGTQGGDLLQSLRSCACATNCTAECDPTLCAGNEPDSGCVACMQAQCSTQLAACQDD